MKRLKISLMISCVFLVASTTAYFLEAQEPRDWKNVLWRVVLESGALEVDQTLDELQDGVPTKVYVRTAFGLKFLQFEKISSDDRRYVRQELGLSEDVDMSAKDFERARLAAEKAEAERKRREAEVQIANKPTNTSSDSSNS